MAAYLAAAALWIPIYWALGWHLLTPPFRQVLLFVPIVSGQALLMGWWVGREDAKPSP